MPPRIRNPKFSSPKALSSFGTRPSTRTSIASGPSRQFSHTPCQQITLRRRKFYDWLNGPGRALKEPLPDSTNYLGAYDKYGNLVRAGPGWKRGGGSQAQEESPAKTPETPAADATPAGQESLDELEAAIRAGEAESKVEKQPQKGVEDDSKLPPETAEDLRPFPLNPYFRSQPVLSEALRESIYQRVKKDGATVSLASVEFGVSNERVGAVVRLKQMEKEWVAQVCLTPLSLPFPVT